MLVIRMPKEKEKRIGAGEFKAKCLKLMDEVQETRIPLIVTKHGKPVVKVIPFVEERKFPYGFMKDQIIIKGDIVGPTGEVWNAEKV